MQTQHRLTAFYVQVWNCQACPPGQYAPANENSQCQDCPAGAYSSGFFGTTCQACGAGFYTVEGVVGASGCMACATGQYSREELSTGCVSCSPGSFSAREGASTCTLCLVDTYLPISGGTACFACTPGQFTPATVSGSGATFCLACPAGSFIRPDLRMCEACPVGRYSSVDGASICQACTVGTFSNGKASACTDCGLGTYSDRDETVYCQLCAPGSFSNRTGRPSCHPCLPGTFLAGEGGSSCLSCDRGTYSPVLGARTCQPCPAGTISERNGTGEEGCDSCGPGTFSTALGVTECEICPVGTFNNGSAQTVCTTCAAGKISGLGARSCLNCSAGTYSEFGMTSCQVCPDGTFSDATGLTALAECRVCEMGKYLQGGGTVCLTCASGFYSPSGASSCLPCPPNSDSQAGAGLSGCVCRIGFRNSWSNDRTVLTCASCLAGTFSAAPGVSTCKECTRGEFSAADGATRCELCAPGRFLAVTGGSVCRFCTAGFYTEIQAATQCLLCGVGVFGGSDGLSACQACAAGRYNTDLSATVCASCATGTFAGRDGLSVCQACSAGTFASSLGLTACTGCPGGTYSGQSGLREAAECTACAGGYFSTGIGLTGPAVCERCAVGKTGDAGATTCGDCRPGQFPNDPYGGCAFCPQNSEPGVNASRPEDCRCSAGYRLGYNARLFGGVSSYYSGPTTRVHVLERNQGFRLFFPTLLNTFCGNTLASRIALPAGQYPTSVSESCQETTVRIEYSVDVQFNASETETYAQCVPCSPGTYSTGMTGEVCQLCPNRTFQDEPGATGCKPCLSGNRLYLGMPKCDPCPGRMVVQDGECQPCPPGLFYPVWATQEACIRCPVNMWSEPTVLGDSECKLCPKDSSGPGGTGFSGCVCGPGLEMSAARTCVKCLAGKYSATNGVCLPCPNGTYSRVAGASQCLRCPNYAVAWNGATVCVACVLGKVPSSDGGSCVPCPAGYFCGFGTVYLCPLGTYSLQTGLVSKTQCPPCPANSFCRSPLTIQSCPANTWSPAGSITRHYCRCNNGFKCTYYFTTSGQMLLSLTPDQLELQREALVAAVAQAAGVSPSKVQIVTTPG